MIGIPLRKGRDIQESDASSRCRSSWSTSLFPLAVSRRRPHPPPDSFRSQRSSQPGRARHLRSVPPVWICRRRECRFCDSHVGGEAPSPRRSEDKWRKSIPNSRASTLKPWIAGSTTRPRSPGSLPFCLDVSAQWGSCWQPWGCNVRAGSLASSRDRNTAGLGWSTSRDCFVDSGPKRACNGRRSRGRILCAITLSRVLYGLLWGVSAGSTNPRCLLLLVLTGLVASFLPASHASRFDPRRFFAPSKLRKIALRRCLVLTTRGEAILARRKLARNAGPISGVQLFWKDHTTCRSSPGVQYLRYAHP